MTDELSQTLERELKLGAAQRFKLPFLPGQPMEPQLLVSTYHDTPELRLAQAGITLRHRVQRRRGLWQLKLPQEDGRLELELPGRGDRMPAEIGDLLRAYVRRAELAPIATLRTRRIGTRVHDLSRPVAEVVHDTVTVLDGRRAVRRFSELEIELIEGDRGDLKQIEAVLRAAGATDGEDRPKVFQALGLPAPAAAARPDPEAPPTELLRIMLERQYREILAHDPGTRLGTDAEELHQMRVATRRFRALLRAGRPLADMSAWEPLRAELAWLCDALGEVRDHDVLIEQLEEQASAFEPADRRAARRLVDLLRGERTEARDALLEVLRSERYLDLLDAVENGLRATVLPTADVSLSDVAGREFRKLRKTVRALGRHPSDAALHAARIRGKRARYAAELAELAVGRRAGDFVQKAKAFQDVVGDHQDAVVAEAKIRSLLARAGGTRTGFAAGRLVELQRARRRKARKRFRPVWRELLRAGRAAWY
ncbi:MAG: CHAD domain-containing protein [Gaiellaceae bacterium]